MSDSRLRKRCMRSRVAYRDKACGLGPEVVAKARPVILGFDDPDLARLHRNSPVATRLSMYLLLQIVSSLGWCLASADAKAAFLQGKRDQSHEPLHMFPPRDGIV